MTQDSLAVIGFEAVQSVQTLNHSVPLLASKQTAIRCYVKPNIAADLQVRGTLCVTISGRPKRIASHNTVQLDHTEHPDKETQRGDLIHSFLFMLDKADVLIGRNTIELETVHTLAGSPIKIDREDNLGSFEIVQGPTLRLHVVGFRIRVPKQDPVHYSPESEYYLKVPRRNDFDAIRSFIERSFPISNLKWSETTIDAPAVFSPPFERSEQSEVLWKEKYKAIEACLTDLRAQDILVGMDHRTHYYGLVPDTSFDGKAVSVPTSARPDVICVGPATGEGELAAHELGHALGLLHIGNEFGCYSENSGKKDEKDPNYPDAYRGFLSSAREAAHGFDVGDGVDGPHVLRFDEYNDMMSYCVPRWSSLYNYQCWLKRLKEEDEL